MFSHGGRTLSLKAEIALLSSAPQGRKSLLYVIVSAAALFNVVGASYVHSHFVDSTAYLLVSLLLYAALALFYVVKVAAVVLRKTNTSVMPILVGLCAMIAVTLMSSIFYRLIDLVRLAAHYSYYAELIAAKRREIPTRPVIFAIHWGGNRGGYLGPNIFFELVYDETDQISMPQDQRSADWLKWAPLETDQRGCFSNREPLIAHYQIIELTCP